MREIGIKELKASLSKTLAAVGRGERIRVTKHGRPVADIVPAAADADSRTGDLIAEGLLTPSAAEFPKKPPPLARGRVRASALVIAERSDSR